LQEVVGILTESHRLKAGGESIDILFWNVSEKHIHTYDPFLRHFFLNLHTYKLHSTA
jgi:hypothetical protein